MTENKKKHLKSAMKSLRYNTGPKMEEKQFIVVGAGMAGLSAAVYLAKAGFKVKLFEKASQTGGLVNSFERNGFIYDGGIRSIEDSGIVFPFIRDLRLDIEFVKSQVSLGVQKDVIRLLDLSSLEDYEAYLRRNFPYAHPEIDRVIKIIKKVISYMDILYGIENPIFHDISKDPEYASKVILPWMIKYVRVMRKILKMHDPVEEYILKYSQNQPLNDNICQHFFKETPAFFALSYFSLYLDYYYPKGGTGIIPAKVEEHARAIGVDIQLNTGIKTLDPNKKIVIDEKGNEYPYEQIVWAANLKTMYDGIPAKDIKNKKVRNKVINIKDKMRSLRGGESVFTLYISVDQSIEHFRNICSEHFFYTPKTTGLSTVDRTPIDNILASTNQEKNEHLNEEIKTYLKEFYECNTFEISCPAMRDPKLAPKGKSAFIISCLFDYQLAKYIKDAGWYEEFKTYSENIIIKTLEDAIFTDLSKKVIEQFSSTPISMQKRTSNLHGALTGWAFDKQEIPVPHKVNQMYSAVETPMPNVYQAGQWSYSPAGLPISIFTGKRAADQIIKDENKKKKGKRLKK